jgi:hypothetical protein
MLTEVAGSEITIQDARPLRRIFGLGFDVARRRWRRGARLLAIRFSRGSVPVLMTHEFETS